MSFLINDDDGSYFRHRPVSQLENRRIGRNRANIYEAHLEQLADLNDRQWDIIGQMEAIEEEGAMDSPEYTRLTDQLAALNAQVGRQRESVTPDLGLL